MLYAEVELRNFKSQYIPCAEAELQAKKYSMCGSASHIITCVRKRNFKSHYSLYVESLVSYATIRSARECRAQGPCVEAILVVLFSTVPLWRWPLLGLF